MLIAKQPITRHLSKETRAPAAVAAEPPDGDEHSVCLHGLSRAATVSQF